ncbi:hypothetical protein [Listeria booriae]|uniref:hypothetical protein n=1 Tax=Listeria booriae TaxID=1552123 RepID=UPI001E56DCEC|nr:hypothetical protein [Listeria booriae]MCD2207267.1 hypothetical protein [Listeria booriae]
MKKYLVLVVVALFSIGLTCLPTRANAEEAPDYKKLYSQGIEEGIINSETTLFEDWQRENEEEFYPNYKEAIATEDGLPEEFNNYETWLKVNNYGVPPEGDLGDWQDVTPGLRATWGGFTVKAGDIFMTNNTDSIGIVGHVAIANSDNYILDMPGEKWNPQNNNNRQLTVASWLNTYKRSGKWVKVYRMNNQTIAKQVAKYADRNYFSTTGSAVKNIKIPYKITADLFSKTPSYCSKLVYQAYYYGSGSLPVLIKTYGIVTPYNIIGYFHLNYRPLLMKTF